MSATADNVSRASSATLVGLAVNIALALVKLIAGILGHSYALIADAVESIADIAGSVVIWGGLHIGARPADDNHPYGHGKAEALAALVVATLVVVAGIGIIVKSIHMTLTPHGSPALFTLPVLMLVVVVKFALSRYVERIARAEGKDAVHVDAGHHLSDAITSAAAFIGISAALLAKHRFEMGDRWASADDWAALLAGLIILYNGARLARLPLRELMDAEPTQVLDEARRIALSVEGVRGIEKTRARTSGSRHYLDMHIEVDPAMTVADAHVITGKVKHAIRAAQSTVADVLIHVEPHDPGAGEGSHSGR
ncbi:MAG: cation transporter [Phycisphaerales bacterium]|nr:cation transporter [Phycisphaerales bacterium]